MSGANVGAADGVRAGRRAAGGGCAGAAAADGGAAAPQTCILAGGRGTRLGERVRDVPKPLLEVAGKPFILHQLRLLASHGVREVVICVGYLAERIVESIGSERFGMHVAYSHDRPGQEGTLQALRDAAPLLDEHFLVLYGDTYLRIDYARAAADWRASGLPAMMSVYRNDGRLGVSNAVYDAGRVSAYDKHSPQSRMHWIDYGLGGLERGALACAPAASTDLADLYHVLAREGMLFGFEATKRFYEIGTPQALGETAAYLRSADAHLESTSIEGVAR